MGVDKIMTIFSIFGCTCPLMFTTVLLLLSAILFPQMNSKHQCNHLKHLLMQCVLLKKTNISDKVYSDIKNWMGQCIYIYQSSSTLSVIGISRLCCLSKLD